MKNNLLLAFQNKQFRNLWLAEIFTQVPVNVFNFLLILVVFQLTQKNTAVSIIVLSFTLPAVFLGILAGVFTDKWNKKKVLFLSNYIRAAFLIVLAIFSKNVYFIYFVSFLFSIVTQFFIPAESPIIPVIVSEEQLLSANALFGVGIFGSVLVSYMFSGPLLLALGFTNTLILLAISMIVGGVLISRIQLPESEEKKSFSLTRHFPAAAVKKEVVDVLQVIRSTEHIMSSLFLLALSQILILIIASIAPGYAKEVLHIRVEQFPVVVITPATFGIIVGALVIANKLQHIAKNKIITTGIFLSGLVLIAMPFGSRLATKSIVLAINTYLPQYFYINNIHIIIFLSFFLGLANAFVFIPANTILQEKTDDTIRGKIYGVLNTFIGIFSFTPVLLAGSFSDIIGVPSVIIGIGIILMLIGIGRIYSKKLKRIW